MYEPNLIFAEAKWKMWFGAESNVEDYLLHGYAESADGAATGCRTRYLSPPKKVFDFCVIQGRRGYKAVFSKVWLGKSAAPASTGLWWCDSAAPSSNFGDYAPPDHARGESWLAFGNCGSRSNESDPSRMFVFFDGGYTKENEPGGLRLYSGMPGDGPARITADEARQRTLQPPKMKGTETLVSRVTVPLMAVLES